MHSLAVLNWSVRRSSEERAQWRSEAHREQKLLILKSMHKVSRGPKEKSSSASPHLYNSLLFQIPRHYLLWIEWKTEILACKAQHQRT